MKIIDLLNKIANGEEVPKKLKHINLIWEYDDYIDYKNGDVYLFDACVEINYTDLNTEVEIIEENKEIEKITNMSRFTRNQKKLAHKINELIDKVNELDKR